MASFLISPPASNLADRPADFLDVLQFITETDQLFMSARMRMKMKKTTSSNWTMYNYVLYI